jgi:hypothetical protein
MEAFFKILPLVVKTSLYSIFVLRVLETTCEFLVFVEILTINFLKPTLFEKNFKKKVWELKNLVTNSLHNKAIKKVI